MDSLDAYDGVALNDETRHLCLKVHFPTTTENGLSHTFNDLRQAVGANVWMSVGQNGCAGTVLAKHAKYFLHTATFLRACIKFSVRVGSCPTLAETIVAFRVNTLCLFYLGQVFLSIVNILSTLNHDGTQTQFNESECGKESTRACTYHQDSIRRRHIWILNRQELIVLRLLIDIQPSRNVYIDGSVTGVDRALQNAHMSQGSDVKPLLSGHTLLDALFRGGLFGQQSELKFGYHRFVMMKILTVFCRQK